jgi:hypothetical protein
VTICLQVYVFVSRGSAAVDCARNEVVIDNIFNGFDAHQLDSGAWRRTFTTKSPTRKLPKQVAFGELCSVVVGGSDHGAVYVFDRKTAATVQVLQHCDCNMVQTVAVRSICRSISIFNSRHFIADT